MTKGSFRLEKMWLRDIYNKSSLKLLVKETKGTSNKHCSLKFIGAEMEEYDQV